MQVICEGKIIEFRDKKRIIPAICMRKGTKDIRILTEDNKEFNLPLNKIIHISAQSIDLNLSKAEQAESLKKITTQAKEINKTINLEELWDLLKDEIKKYSLEEIAELNFDPKPSFIQESGMLRALIDDCIYFDLKAEGVFEPRDEEAVKNLKYQQELSMKRANEKSLLIEWMKKILDNPEIKEEPPLKPDKYIKLLKDAAVLGNESDDYPKAVEWLEQLGYKGHDIKNTALNYLIKLGIWDEDENLYLYQYNIKESFTGEAIEEVGQIKQNSAQYMDISKRLDLRNVETITIDDEDTRDIDDAFSIECLDNGYCLGIHIADVAEFIPQGSKLDKEAHTRAITVYLPDRNIEMLPLEMSWDICSLVAGQDRMAVSILIYLDSNYEITDYKIAETVINVKRRLSYDEADTLISSDPVLNRCSIISDNFQKKRISNGALMLSTPELKIKVDKDKNIKIKKISSESSSRIMIAELMIISNNLFARYFKEKNIPMIYRTQEVEAGIKLPPAYDPIFMRKNKGLWKKAEATIKPLPHSGLGLPVYTQMTSPIRRYADLIVHRQLKEVLHSGNPLYTEADMQNIIIFSEQMLNMANIIQRQTNRYWLLKYLNTQKDQVLDALVLEVEDGKIHVHLTDYVLDTILMPKLETKVSEGDKISVKIKNVNPRAGNILIGEE